MSDIEIAQANEATAMWPITKVAAGLGLSEDDLKVRQARDDHTGGERAEDAFLCRTDRRG